MNGQRQYAPLRHCRLKVPAPPRVTEHGLSSLLPNHLTKDEVDSLVTIAVSKMLKIDLYDANTDVPDCSSVKMYDFATESDACSRIDLARKSRLVCISI